MSPDATALAVSQARDPLVEKTLDPLGLPGAANRKCTVRDVAEIITLWPSQESAHNSWKIKGRICAYFIGFLATLRQVLLCNRT